MEINERSLVGQVKSIKVEVFYLWDNKKPLVGRVKSGKTLNFCGTKSVFN